MRERKIRNYFSSCRCFSQIHSEFREMLSNCIRCFWSHRSRKEGLDNAGWSGRSYIVLLVVFVLNVDDGQMNGLSMLATMFSRLNVPNCDRVFMRLKKNLQLFNRMIQKTFFFLSSPSKPKRSSTILLSLSFSRESSMSECVKKM